jgi:hypothetical protein
VAVTAICNLQASYDMERRYFVEDELWGKLKHHSMKAYWESECPTTSKNNMADRKYYEVEATLAPLNLYSEVEATLAPLNLYSEMEATLAPLYSNVTMYGSASSKNIQLLLSFIFL